MEILSLNSVVEVKPNAFQQNLTKILEKILHDKVSEKIKTNYGKIKEIIKIENIEQLKILDNGHAQFDITFQAKIFKLSVNDIFKGKITCVNKAGLSLDTEDYKCGVPEKLMDTLEFSLQDNAYIGKNVKIQTGDIVTLKVLRTRQEETFYHAICNLVLE
jgi:DNA-directed RNA polymerase subunit E'/Rpb7